VAGFIAAQRAEYGVMNLQPSGPLRFVAPLAVSRVKSAVAANLDTLKQILETGRRPT